MNLLDKWKVFAFRQMIDTEVTDEEAVKHFDAITATDSPMSYMDDHGLTEWEPFQFLSAREFSGFMRGLAQHAQDVEGQQL